MEDIVTKIFFKVQVATLVIYLEEAVGLIPFLNQSLVEQEELAIGNKEVQIFYIRLPLLLKMFFTEKKWRLIYKKKYNVKYVMGLDVNLGQTRIHALHVMAKVRYVKVEVWDLHHL